MFVVVKFQVRFADKSKVIPPIVNVRLVGTPVNVPVNTKVRVTGFHANGALVFIRLSGQLFKYPFKMLFNIWPVMAWVPFGTIWVFIRVRNVAVSVMV